jgi:hypothetical protein
MKVRQEVLDTYWYFAAERQKVLYRRLRGEIPPYTADPILQHYKFCNVYRACDRVSQFLIRNMIYCGDFSDTDQLFRIMLFRLLNKNETWQWLEERLGEISLATFDVDCYSVLLNELRQSQPIYGNAFILCANKAFGFERKHANHLALLKMVFVKSDTWRQLLDAQSLKELFERLRGLPLLVDFMAYQLAIDMNYSEVFDFSENDFTVAGPGALRGVSKCFKNIEIMSPSDIILWMVEHQDEKFERLGLDFENLGGRKLQTVDCQGLFCEVDKYCRVKFPELASNRSRIKAQFVESPRLIDYFFPPKWQVVLKIAD